MNRRTPEQDLERLLDADRGDFGAIYDRLARTEPPRRLDRAILAEASRTALGPRAPRTQRWLLALGSTAGLVLAAGIAWQVGHELETKQADHVAGSAPKAVPRDVVPVQSIESAAAPVDAQPPPPAVAPPAVSAAREREARLDRAETERSRRVERAESAKPVAAAPPPAPAAPAAADMAAPAAEQSMPPAAAKTAVPHEAAEPAPFAEAPARTADGLSGGAPAASAARSAVARERMPATPSTSMQLRSNMQLAPSAWIAEIRRLADAGQRQQAAENLRLFRRMHPDWPVDEDLRRLDE